MGGGVYSETMASTAVQGEDGAFREAIEVARHEGRRRGRGDTELVLQAGNTAVFSAPHEDALG